MELRTRKAMNVGKDFKTGEVTTKAVLRNRMYQRRFYLKNRLAVVQAGETDKQGYTAEQITAELDKVNTVINKYRGKGPGRPAKKSSKRGTL